jgi:tRNA(Leu) C34 or U34 (ribose-2'-O)-methylase TrmL
MANAEDKKDEAKATGKQAGGRQVKWNDKELTTSYANVCNVSSTREEVTLLFGTNETGLNKDEMSVRLTERIILSPFAAKRLAQVIGNVMAEYEKRFGKLDS